MPERPSFFEPVAEIVQKPAGMDASESSRVVVSRLAAVREQLVADVPLGVQGDAARQACLLVCIACVSPKIASTWGAVGAVVITEGLTWRMDVGPPGRQP
jgi:hypothetical protein